MKILFLVADGIAPGEDSGAGTHIEADVSNFTRLGAEVLPVYHLPAGQRPSGTPSEPMRNLFRRFLGSFPFLRGLKNDLGMIFRNLSFRKKIRAELKKASFRPDVIYERSCYLQVAGWWLSRRHRIPIFYELNRPLVDEARRFLGSRLGPLGQWLERLKYGSASAVFSVGTVHRYTGIQRANYVPIQNGVFHEEFRRESARDTRRRELGLDDKLVVGYSGYVLPWYDLKLFRVACERLLPTHPEIRFLVVGWGEWGYMERFRAELGRAGIGSAFTFTGRVSKRAAREYTDAMDVATIPFSEPFGSNLKLFEYGASGRPVLAGRYENLQTFLEDGRDCTFFDPNDETDFVAKLSSLLSNPALRETTGRNLRIKIESHYTWEKIVSSQYAVMLSKMGRRA